MGWMDLGPMMYFLEKSGEKDEGSCWLRERLIVQDVVEKLTGTMP